jgi:glycosyltransferase involved in cell wall biosynthesis
MSRRLRVLLSAYACEPGKGSDPGVGWSMAVGAAREQDVWVLTRANNRLPIETEMAGSPVADLHFIYYDLPAWARFWKKGQKGLHLYYYLWQVGALRTARRAHDDVGFDLVHHVTFVKYWIPSLVGPGLGIPFVWGPVGGGETVPKGFRREYGRRGRLFELARGIGRWAGDHDPLVRRAARGSAVALATTATAAARIARLGAPDIRVVSEAALPGADVEHLAAMPPPGSGNPFRVVSLGRLQHFKGFHLGIEAFALAAVPGSEYWIVGAGPERQNLEELSRRSGVADRVRFFGEMARADALDLLAECHVLLHPSLRESGGWVCLEGMAAGRPVVCFDLGGPGVQVTDDTGVKVPAVDRTQAVTDIARALRWVAEEPAAARAMGERGRDHVRRHYEWGVKSAQVSALYKEVLDRAASSARALEGGVEGERDRDGPVPNTEP